jgi:hypothetical protein
MVTLFIISLSSMDLKRNVAEEGREEMPDGSEVRPSDLQVVQSRPHLCVLSK